MYIKYIEWWQQRGSTPWLFLEQFLCSWVWKQPWLVESKGRCRRREVQHCRTGRCGWDRMCGAVRAAPLLTSLLFRQVACRLECCIAAEAQRANQEWKLHTREESEVENRLSAALLFSQNCRPTDGVLSTGLRVLGHWWVHGHGKKQISAYSANLV